VQVKLLRFLEEREFERVGGNRTFKVDVRIVVATHRDLEKKVAEGTFREDLYYRLNVVEIHIPALRERAGDIPLLAQHFLSKFAAANDKDVRGFDDDVLTMFLRHAWPGNVRELENAMERAVVMTNDAVLTPAHFPTLRRAVVRSEEDGATSAVSIPGSTLEEIEREAILRTLEAVGGSTSRASEILQISPRKIQYKVKEYHQRGAVAEKVTD
jgi:two-component system NtrC family response regulator/two-component system response regulator HydG